MTGQEIDVFTISFDESKIVLSNKLASFQGMEDKPDIITLLKIMGISINDKR